MTVESSGNITFEGEEHISIFEGSNWAERGFCSKCGSHLFYRLKDKSLNFCNFNLGTIEGHEEFKFTTQIYVDSKPNCYSFSNPTKNMTEKEVLAANGFE